MKKKKSLVKRLSQCCIILGASIGMSLFTSTASAEIPYVEFPSIDGGNVNTAEWRGKPYLVVNTASRCGFTSQYSAMQKLYNKYNDRGFNLLAVPSDDFNQELSTDTEVKDFCELTYGLDIPMTTRLSIKGDNAHPFYKAVKSQDGFVPLWNFSKVLIGAEGKVLGTWGPLTGPLSPKITNEIEAALLEPS
jgi:glutathione peroxidase